jgi:hypothetical protein
MQRRQSVETRRNQSTTDMMRARNRNIEGWLDFFLLQISLQPNWSTSCSAYLWLLLLSCPQLWPPTITHEKLANLQQYLLLVETCGSFSCIYVIETPLEVKQTEMIVKVIVLCFRVQIAIFPSTENRWCRGDLCLDVMKPGLSVGAFCWCI